MEEINRLYESVLAETKLRMDTLLSLCESPIEKLFFIHLFNHYYKLSLNFIKLDFIVEAETNENIDTLKYNYVEELTLWPLRIKGLSIKGHNFHYDILPQFSIYNEGNQIRMDFAIMANFISDNDSKQKHRKFCIECDGHEWHHTKEQLSKDNERARILAKLNWTVLRFTGSEIFQFDSDKVINFDNVLYQSLTGKEHILYAITKSF